MCPSDPAKVRAHPAAVIELALLELDEESFNESQPKHAQTIKGETAAVTGISWIDEAERRLFSKEI